MEENKLRRMERHGSAMPWKTACRTRQTRQRLPTVDLGGYDEEMLFFGAALLSCSSAGSFGLLLHCI